MIKNFERFVESVETIPFFLSKELRKILSVMSDEGNVYAKALLENHAKNLSMKITFINITKKNDELTFITHDRVMRLYDDSKVDFKTWLSIVYDDERQDVWNKMRNPIKVGKFFSKFARHLSLKSGGEQQEQFVNQYKATYDIILDRFNDFEIVKGEDIRKCFLYENYESLKGQLGNSCMRYKQCQSYFDIYVENPKTCSMLILRSKDNVGKIRGRAMLFETNLGTFMDRIYTNNDSDIVIFNRYRNSKKMVDPFLSHKCHIDLEKWEFDEYPYLDTFKFLNIEDSRLYAEVLDETDSNIYKLQQADGTFLNDSIWSEYEGEYIPEDESVYSEEYGHIRQETSIYIEGRGHFPESASEVTWSQFFETYYHVDDCHFSEFLEDHIPQKESIAYLKNSKQEIDYIPEDMKGILVDILVDGSDRYSLPEYVIFDPISDGFRFKDELVDIGGKKLMIGEYLIDKVGKVDKKKLIETIKTFSGDINKVLMSLLYVNSNRSDVNFSMAIRYFLKTRDGEKQVSDQFIELLKFFLIFHIVIGKKEIEDVMSNRAVYSFRRFNQLLIDDRMDPYLNMISKEIFDMIYDKQDWRRSLAWTCYKLSLVLRNHIIEESASKLTFEYVFC